MKKVEVRNSENKKIRNSEILIFLPRFFVYFKWASLQGGSTGKFLAKDFLTLLSNNSIYNRKKGVGHIFIMARRIIGAMIISQSI